MTALDKPGRPRGVLGRLRRAFDDVHAVRRYWGTTARAPRLRGMPEPCGATVGLSALMKLVLAQTQ